MINKEIYNKINWKDSRNLTMLTDFYELTMMNGYMQSRLGNLTAYFDMFFRKVPDEGGFAIMAGVEQIIQYINNISFEEEDINYLRSKGVFPEEFLDYLRNFKFTGDIWAIPEGTPIFPNEPIVTVKAPVMEVQFIETMILLTINHQSLIATKANRIVRAADGRPVMEFGSRRAQGYDGAVYGARAAYVGGCNSTACTIAEEMFGIPAVGTMAHSWVQLFPSEYEAFKAWTNTNPDNCILLVDTYNVLKSGIPNAIKVFDEILRPLGKRPKGIRIDSGDITYLSNKCREMLDKAGYEECKITVSSSLDEYIIRDVITQGAKVDSFGVGERLITSKSESVFGGVYKLSAIELEGNIIPKIKISENETKTTNPGFKITYRLFDKATNKAIADVITLKDETIDETQVYEIFDPVYTWKRKKIRNFYVRKLQVPIFEKGECVYKTPTLQEIQDYCKEQLETLWPELMRFENPHKYYVDLSTELWNLKNKLLNELSFED
ncbi:MAG: nicotinate phosphoribosyltransferase [Bacillota bacterium]|nr:nicotinate phosphoribosyltransferase [Bacillota bacterium]